MAVTAPAIIALLLGLLMAAGGGWLFAIGGSPYYAIAGAALLLTAALLFARRRAALWVFAVLLVGTLVWSLAEVGLDWWLLAPRGGLLVLLGLWLAAPPVTRRLRPAGGSGRVRPAAPLAAALALSFFAGVVAILFGETNQEAGSLPSAAPAVAGAGAGTVADGDWRAYGRTVGGNRYSPLTGIDTENVRQLEVVWTFRTGDLGEGGAATFEAAPLEIDDTIFLCTPRQWVIAIDATSGAERWRFDPMIDPVALGQHQTCRGVSYFEAADAAGDCGRRIFLATGDARLIALDADTGRPCAAFADSGEIDLWTNVPNRRPGLYFHSSPPLVAGGLVIVGGSVSDNVTVDNPSGAIRAYDATTGALVWNFDPGNPEDTAPIGPGAMYTPNAPNAWSVLSADEGLELVFVPMGNVSPDQWGADRTPETERFSASVIALDLATGTLVWEFQAVHHDLWDMDTPAQPVVVDLDIGGELVPALVQATKQGDVYMLDRRTGIPIHPVTELPAPQGAAPGDFTATTQPVSAITFMPDRLEERDMWGVTMLDQLLCRIKYRSLDYDGRYTPPSTRGSLQHPGNFGVFNWGSVAVDPIRQVMFATPAYVAFAVRLVPRPDDVTNVVSGGEAGTNENYGAPYAVDIGDFVSPLGIPCQGPPWGYVAGVDLRTAETMWRRPNGTVRDLAPIPLPFAMGVPSLGGPIITAGGLAFLSGALDNFLRAYDLTTGEELWRGRLPAGGQATPISYATVDGRQFILAVAGGHGALGTARGDYVIAYALPGPP